MTTVTTDSPVRSGTTRLRDLALGAVAALVPSGTATAAEEIAFLAERRNELLASGRDWNDLLEAVLRSPAPGDAPLLDLGAALGLSAFEELTVALAAAVEEDALVGRALARLQAPIGAARPTLSLLSAAFASFLPPGQSGHSILLNGPAVTSGLLALQNDSAPLPERFVLLPTPLALALAGQPGAWPGITVGLPPFSKVHLPESARTEALRQAGALQAMPESGLLLRSGSFAEARAVADELAQVLHKVAAFIETDKLAGVGPWLRLRNLLPVFVCDLAPSERRVLAPLPGYDGPLLALAGLEGGVESSQGPLPSWILSVPAADERAHLWKHALGDGAADLAEDLARNHRHAAGRIAQIGRLARRAGLLRSGATSPQPAPLQKQDVHAASWTAEGGGLDSLAEPLNIRVDDAALVVPRALRDQLELLALRCTARDRLVDGLGPSATTRYRPGLRALYTGPSGTGKTLAAGWLATRTGLPLYRVDLASVTSKYIGETEKNLAQLLGRAEYAEVILLFDEADSLFGKRTDIRDSNDRFANAQTNYLLQRIENYDGIVLLTSNSRARFDSAFARRLDCVIEFDLPSPDERRDLWLAHLGDHHTLAPLELNRLAALADVAGGHIRNAVLTAALLANVRKITQRDCIRALQMEYRKISRQFPGELETILRLTKP